MSMCIFLLTPGRDVDIVVSDGLSISFGMEGMSISLENIINTIADPVGEIEIINDKILERIEAFQMSLIGTDPQVMQVVSILDNEGSLELLISFEF